MDTSVEKFYYKVEQRLAQKAEEDLWSWKFWGFVYVFVLGCCGVEQELQHICGQ